MTPLDFGVLLISIVSFIFGCYIMNKTDLGPLAVFPLGCGMIGFIYAMSRLFGVTI